MKSVKKVFSIVPVATFIFCVAAATAFAGQHGFSGSVSRGAGFSGNISHGQSHQVQVRHTGASGSHQAGYGIRGNHGQNGNVRVQANHGGRTGMVHADRHGQAHGHRGFSF